MQAKEPHRVLNRTEMALLIHGMLSGDANMEYAREDGDYVYVTIKRHDPLKAFRHLFRQKDAADER